MAEKRSLGKFKHVAKTRVATTAKSGGEGISAWYLIVLQDTDGLLGLFDWTGKYPVALAGATHRMSDVMRLFRCVAATDFGRGSRSMKLPLKARSIRITEQIKSTIVERCRATGNYRDPESATSNLAGRGRTLVRFGAKNPFVAVYDPSDETMQIVSTQFGLEGLRDAARFFLADPRMAAFGEDCFLPTLQPARNRARKGTALPAKVTDPRWDASYRGTRRGARSVRKERSPRELPTRVANRRERTEKADRPTSRRKNGSKKAAIRMKTRSATRASTVKAAPRSSKRTPKPVLQQLLDEVKGMRLELSELQRLCTKLVKQPQRAFSVVPRTVEEAQALRA